MRREDSRLSLAAGHLPIPNGSNRENRTGPTSTADLLRPLRFEQPGTVGREELIGRGWLFDEVRFLRDSRTVRLNFPEATNRNRASEKMYQSKNSRFCRD